MRVIVAALLLGSSVVGCSNSTSSPAKPATPAPAASNAAPATTTTAAVPGEAQGGADSDGEFGIGDDAPSFDGLTGTDDKPHSLRDYADAKAVAVVFTCNHCPVAVAYEDRLVAIQKDYAEKGVEVVAINVNNMEADKLPAMKDRAKEKGFEFTYAYDPSQKSARDYGAMVTPHVFLLDGKQRLAYRGAIDDSMDESKVTKKHLRDAIDALLTGNSPETTDTKPVGCGIQYE